MTSSRVSPAASRAERGLCLTLDGAMDNIATTSFLICRGERARTRVYSYLYYNIVLMLLQAIKRTFSCRFAMIKLVSLYKKPIRLFDQSVGSKIAKIPDSLYGPLAVLCLIIHPVGWLLLVIIGSGIA